MKRKLFSLAFMLVFAFTTSALADGETGNGGKAINPPPAAESSSSTDFFTQIMNAFYSANQ